MRGNNQGQGLAALVLAGAMLVPASAAADGVFMGAQLGGASLAADSQGPGAAFADFSHGTTFSGAVLAGYASVFSDQHYRIVGSLGHSEWDNARLLETMGGADLLWRQDDNSGAVYVGPRIGAVRFSDDLTGDSNARFAWGIEVGALTSLGTVSGAGDRPLSAGLFLRHTVIDARQSGVAGNGLARDINVSGQTSFGVQILIEL